MSDTVKMIVEIPEEQYRRIVKAPRCVDFSEAVEDRTILCKAIKNGKLLSERAKGEWKVGFGNTWCSCSECSSNGSTNWSYCPWCGADMRGDI